MRRIPPSSSSPFSPAARALRTPAGLPGFILALCLLVGCHCALELRASPAPPEAARGDSDSRADSPEFAFQFGHRGLVTTIAVASQGTLLATGSEDCRVRLWDTRTRECREEFFPEDQKVDRVALSPAGDQVAWSSLWGLSLRVTNPPAGATVPKPRVVYGSKPWTLSFSPDGLFLAAAFADNWIRVFNTRSSKLVASIPSGSARLTALDYSPDGKYLVGISDTELLVWSRPVRGEPARVRAGEARFLCLALSPDGRLAAVGDGAGVIRIWTIASPRLLCELPGDRSPIRAVAFSPDGNWVAGGSEDGHTRIWVRNDGLLVRRLYSGPERIHSLAFLPETRDEAPGLIVGNRTRQVRIWNFRTGQDKGAFGDSGGGVKAVACSPDGRFIASASQDRTLRLWDAQTGELLHSFTDGVNPLECVAFSPDGRWLACGGGIGAQVIRVYDTRTWTVRHTLSGFFLPANSLTFSPDSRLLVCGGYAVAGVYDIHSGQLLKRLSGHELWISAVTFSPDGRTLATASGDWTVRLWEMPEGKLRRVLSCYPGRLYAAAFSPDGRHLVTSDGDNKVRFWDPQTGKEVRTLPYCARSLAFSPDGTTLVCGMGATIRRIDFLNVQTGELQNSIDGTLDEPCSLAFTPDGSTLVSAHNYGAVHLWNARGAQRGKLKALLFGLPSEPAQEHPAQADSGGSDDYFILTPEGYYAGSPAADRRMRLRLGGRLFPAECFESYFYRPDLVKNSIRGEAIPVRGKLRGPFPPQVTFQSARVVDGPPDGLARLSLQARDDRRVEKVVLFVDGKRVAPQQVSTAASTAATRSRPIKAESKALRGANRVLKAESKPGPEPSPTTAPNPHRFGPAAPTPYVSGESFIAGVPFPPGARPVRIQAIAYDENGLQSPRAEIILARPSTVHGPVGRLLALCIGVSRYQDPRLRLQYAAADARALAQALQRQNSKGSDASALYAATRTTQLTDENATRTGIMRELERLSASVSRRDTVVLFLSGHGWRDRAGQYYFATYEANRARPSATALKWSDVVVRLTRISERAQRVVVLLDTCHSGGAVSSEELVRAVLSAETGVMVLASCRRGEVSLESTDLRHGLFTHALLEVLNGQATPAAEARVSLWDLAVHVRRRVRELSEGTQNPQLPFLQDFDLDAPFIVRP